MTLEAIDHVQAAMPAGEEDRARAFYRDLLGLPEQPKPPELARRGGCWFESDAVKVHLGVETPFTPARKAHIAFRVDDVMGLAARARAAGYEVVDDDLLPGHERVYIYDPFGNRLEFLRPIASPFPLEGGRVGDGGEPTSQERRPAAGSTARARRLRRESTVAERALWSELRKRKLNFRRQAPIGRFVADFAHLGSKLLIEIDGYHHGLEGAAEKDAARTSWLEGRGFRVLRYSEKAVRDNPGQIADEIVAETLSPPSPTLPPSRGKGEEVLRA